MTVLTEEIVRGNEFQDSLESEVAQFIDDAPDADNTIYSITVAVTDLIMSYINK